MASLYFRNVTPMSARTCQGPHRPLCRRPRADCPPWKHTNCTCSFMCVNKAMFWLVLTDTLININILNWKVSHFVYHQQQKNIIHPTQVRMHSPSCLQNLYFCLLLSLPGWHRLRCSCNISNISLAKNNKRKVVLPLNFSFYILFILLQSSQRISHMAKWAQTFVFNMNKTTFPVYTSAQVRGHAMRKVCPGL